MQKDHEDGTARSATEIRAKAAEYRDLADRSPSEGMRDHWLFLERQWLELAATVDRIEDQRNDVSF